MSLDQQKEATAKAICLYVADLIEKQQVKMVEAARVMSFLVSGMEGAKSAQELKVLEQEMRQVYPKLPVFSPGV